MKVFFTLFTLGILTAARPDGYTYSAPVPLQQYLPPPEPSFVPTTPLGSSFNSLTVPGPVAAPQVHKNIYIYVPPAEQESVVEQQNYVTPSVPQVHYKILFIKAPTYEQQLRQQAAAAAAVQEKTLVYVLSKRPDDILDQPTTSPAEYQPSKPEVYFIKYKTHQAVANQVHAQSQVQGQVQVPAPVYGTPSFGQDPRSTALESGRAPINSDLPVDNSLQAL